MNLQDKVVVVTGASSGIGRETAVAFARKGAVVVAVARREERLKTLLEELKGFSRQSCYLAGDLGEKAFARYIIEETVNRYGRLDVLVNNAAVPIHRLIYRISAEEAEDVMRINFLSCLWTCFAAIPYMLRQGDGTIVNVSSFASKIPPVHETIYVASKCAMNGFTRGLWNDLKGSGIHAALVHPGPIDTEIWDKHDQDGAYSGTLYPPAVVATEILRAVEHRKYELVAPRYNFTLLFARLLNLVAPSLVRMGAARMDPVREEDLQQVKQAVSREVIRMGEFT